MIDAKLKAETAENAELNATLMPVLNAVESIFASEELKDPDFNYSGEFIIGNCRIRIDHKL
jgi:hypothetical protein